MHEDEQPQSNIALKLFSKLWEGMIKGFPLFIAKMGLGEKQNLYALWLFLNENLCYEYSNRALVKGA